MRVIVKVRIVFVIELMIMNKYRVSFYVRAWV